MFAIFYGQTEIIKYIMSQTYEDQDFLWQLQSLLTFGDGKLDELNMTKRLRTKEKIEFDKENVPSDDGRDPEEEPNQFLEERQSLIPLILPLINNDAKTFELIWNEKRLWNKHIYLILVWWYVLESENESIIKSFIGSEKTKTLFNMISLSEKQKFIQYILYSLQAQKFDDSKYHSKDTMPAMNKEFNNNLTSSP